MLLLWLSLSGLIGVSLLAFLVSVAGKRRMRGPGRAHYARPPSGWPDVPIRSLGLFDRTGRINQPMPRQSGPPRVACFEDAQDVLLSRVASQSGARPDIAMRLSPQDAVWTEVLLDGTVVVQLPTYALTGPANQTARAA
jgi:hypothetical protein